jgi:hypothetical protein
MSAKCTQVSSDKVQINWSTTEKGSQDRTGGKKRGRKRTQIDFFIPFFVSKKEK